MAITKVTEKESNAQEQEKLSPECKELLSSLPKEKGQRTPYLFLYQGFWCQPKEIQAIISVQKHYKAEDTDLIFATIPNSGTTWLKALSFAIVNRRHYHHSQKSHPLLTSNPHELVPFLEYKLFANNQIPDISSFPRPPLLATHMPLGAMHDSVRGSSSKLVYLARNPFDTFVSIYHFLCKIRPKSLGPFLLEEAFDMYCRGVMGFGPYWEHMLGYWYESLRSPHKVLFLKYEEMKENTSFELKKMAEFLGFPFSIQEEKDGVVEGIAKMCSFEHLKDLEVNKKGKGAIADFLV
ncbi:hypothetical protein BUALT_Bualt01G0151000 [Buddleja alternifolia]|uniref:Sulfotransferase n=1 Tax=Buddleja alternifolia TaxID=168488 RepID=A0AAV6YE91_9LAMI|nr:hypothetical protein BUALT_Bualt01G0151000 [Buddleja alternifolia]